MPVVVIVGYGLAAHAKRERQKHRPHSGCIDYTMKQGVNAGARAQVRSPQARQRIRFCPTRFRKSTVSGGMACLLEIRKCLNEWGLFHSKL